MLLVNTGYIAGKEVQMLGLVKGNTVRAKNFGKDIGQGFKNLVGGELKSYTKMIDEAREIATERMIEEATELGADAIVNVRFATSSVVAGAAEIIVYGTAVKIK